MITFKPQQNPPPSTESGFTVIESLMALIVVSILMIALSPVIVLSVATRVQSRRVESATQAAQSYIDALRAQTIDAPPISAALSIPSLNSIAAPTPSALTCNSGAYCTAPTNTAYQLYCVDGDGGGCTRDSVKDMIVQAFGVNRATSATTNEERADQGYELGIRVYRADAFSGSEPLRPTQQDIDNNERVTQSPTTGDLIRNRKDPLIEITTEIVTEDTGYSDFRERLSPP